MAEQAMVAVEPERWKETAKSRKSASRDKAADVGRGNSIRRPTRGIVLKDDTYASLQVITGKNESITLLDGGSARKDADGKDLLKDNNPARRATDVYSNFLIQQVNEERAEKQQILETFGEPYIFLFGERARILNIQGVLLNTFDFNWEAEWWENYENYLRGTRCVETDSRVFLTFDDTLVSGYILACTSSKSSQDRNHVPLAFQLFVTSYTDIGNRIGNPTAKPPWLKEPIDLNDMAARAPFRPTIINGMDTLGNPDLGIGDNLLQTAAFQKVRGFFSAAQDIVNKLVAVTNTAISQFDVDAVRVPIGFAGATVFDEQVIDLKVTSTQITYSTFDANWDEYVGNSGQYASSVTDDGANKMDDLFQDTTAQSNKNLMDQAKKDWNRAGYLVPEQSLGIMSAWVAGKAVGAMMGNVLKNATPSTALQNAVSNLPLSLPSAINAIKGARSGGKVGIDGY